MTRIRITIAGLILVCGASLQAQQSAAEPARAGSFSAQLNWYALPDQPDFVQPTVSADRGAWHFEARYNYEDQHTGSLFVGRGFTLGDKLEITVTPMLGGVVGGIDGIVPALELDLTFGPVEWYVESEYVWNVSDVENNFVYAWSELSVHLTPWLRTGIVGQRTRAYQTDRDVQRGFLLEASPGRFRAGVWWFNPGGDDAFLILGLGVDF